MDLHHLSVRIFSMFTSFLFLITSFQQTHFHENHIEGFADFRGGEGCDRREAAGRPAVAPGLSKDQATFLIFFDRSRIDLGVMWERGLCHVGKGGREGGKGG